MTFTAAALIAFAIGWMVRDLLDRIMLKVVTRSFVALLGKERVAKAVAQAMDDAADRPIKVHIAVPPATPAGAQKPAKPSR